MHENWVQNRDFSHKLKNNKLLYEMIENNFFNVDDYLKQCVFTMNYIYLHSFYRTNLFSVDIASPSEATIKNHVLHWPQRWDPLS